MSRIRDVDICASLFEMNVPQGFWATIKREQKMVSTIKTLEKFHSGICSARSIEIGPYSTYQAIPMEAVSPLAMFGSQ